MLVPHWQGLGHVAPAENNHSLICWPGDIILKNHKTLVIPHDEDGEADKDEKGATDSDHGKCPEVDLAIP